MMTPLLFNLKNKKVLVVGGGKVAARRIVTLLENGMQVIAVSPDFSEAIIKTENCQLTLIHAGYHKDQLTDIDLAVAATDNRELNHQIRTDCASLKIWCNRVDDPEDSDFIFPSVIRRGDLTLSVCTEGASPFLTKNIVAELANRYDESYTEKTALLRSLRQTILAGAGSQKQKTEKLKELANCSNAELRSKLGNN
ncbi:MAG: bifunctional precorrin-2 dehydrogenase/sirohydrochlorin ferrochelatase [Acetobacterium sp.]|nr:bifunctional precorrin-2 dehydrogenase/sirohydrochlorin ferrochelatase [Bacillota bacterium]MCG2730073.1 bifunctional precorrin-2 dehydrogenase/sirohydrochlorin ferrochelatase [Acetobacterium sp.]